MGSHGLPTPAPHMTGDRLIAAIERVVRVARGVPGLALFATCTIAVALLGLLDYFTGPDISLSILYLIPVTFAALARRPRAGYAIALLSAGAWLAADIFARPVSLHLSIHFWNSFVRFGFFSISTALIGGLTTMIAREKALSEIDPLTGALNWRGFKHRFDSVEILAPPQPGPVTLAYIDLDNFKTVNDTKGHDEGDRVLSAISARAQELLRASDIFARVGGDEFVILLFGAEPTEAREILARMLDRLTAHMRDSGWPVTFSAGAATFTRPPDSPDQMVKTVDTLMYEVKNRGKNGLKHISVPGEGT